MNWKEIFPQFEPGLIEVIEKEAVQRRFNAGDIIMRTGQYINSTALVLEAQSLGDGNRRLAGLRLDA